MAIFQNNYWPVVKYPAGQVFQVPGLFLSMPQDLLTVKLDRLAMAEMPGQGLHCLRGDGGRAVFVPSPCQGKRAYPGGGRETRPFARELVDVLEPSAQRIQPKCRIWDLRGVSLPASFLSGATPGKNRHPARPAFAHRQDSRSFAAAHDRFSQEWNYRNHVQFHLTQDANWVISAASQRGVVPFPNVIFLKIPEHVMARPGIRPGLGLERISCAQACAASHADGLNPRTRAPALETRSQPFRGSH